MTFVYVATVLLTAAAIVANAAPVTGVDVVKIGKAPMDEGSVRSQIRTSTGSEFDPNVLSSDVRKLLDTGLYENVDAAVEKASDGVRVILRVRANRRLAANVEVTGSTRYDADDIRDWLGLRLDDKVSDAILGARVQKILEEYRDDLYPDAAVTWVIRDADVEAGTATVTVQVREGERSWIREAKFPGATVFSAAKLKRALEMRAWFNPMRLFRRDRYDAASLEIGRLTIQQWYAERGYLDVKVGAPEITRESGGVSVSMPVSEGPLYRVGTVSFAGVERFPDSDLRKAAGMNPGAVASAPSIDAAVQGVRNSYGSKGYVDTTVQPVLDADPAVGIVNVRFVVRESGQVSIRNVRIRGNAVTKDKVIRRELTVYPGDIMNEVEAARSERRLQNLGFFSSVRHYQEETSLPTERDLVYDLEEGRSGQMMIGAGFSSIDRMMLFLDITHGNFDIGEWPFRGGGQKLKLNAQLGGTRKDISISFTEPWFLDRRLALSTELYHTDVDYDDYDLRRYGASVSLTKGLFWRVRGTLQYRIERESISNIGETNNYVYVDGPEDTSWLGYIDPYGNTNTFLFATEESRANSAVRASLSYDDRDHPFIPHRGVQASLYFQVSGGALGADTDLYQTGFKAAYYVSPWFGHVISLQASYDTVESYGQMDDVPIGSRLFAGGGRTIRGFGYRDVGPKVGPISGDNINPYNYRPFGGKSRALGGVEYIIPLFSMLRLAVFYDTGNVWRDAFDVDLSDMAASCGVGLRFDIPGFPIRIDRAWTLRKDGPLTDEDMTVFWIGY